MLRKVHQRQRRELCLPVHVSHFLLLTWLIHSHRERHFPFCKSIECHGKVHRWYWNSHKHSYAITMEMFGCHSEHLKLYYSIKNFTWKLLIPSNLMTETRFIETLWSLFKLTLRRINSIELSLIEYERGWAHHLEFMTSTIKKVLQWMRFIPIEGIPSAQHFELE